MSGQENPRNPGAVHGARLCRFTLDDGVPLLGFYGDERVIPIDLAAERYAEVEEVDLILPAAEDLLELLPPDGPSSDSLQDLARWIAGPGAESADEVALAHSEVHLLVPIPQPRKIFLLAGNYAAHILEGGGRAAERADTFPYVFMKPSTTLTHPGSPIVIPRSSPDHIDWECELGVVIGHTCRHVSEAEALEYVAGYTVVNDISDRGFRPNPGRQQRDRDAFFDWLHGKWHDASCPVGPCLATRAAIPDPQNLELTLKVNGVVRQQASTGQMIFPVAAIIAFLSELVTLEPGDIISTGTPAGVGNTTRTFLKPGDVVQAEIQNIGRLENPVIAEA